MAIIWCICSAIVLFAILEDFPTFKSKSEFWRKFALACLAVALGPFTLAGVIGYLLITTGFEALRCLVEEFKDLIDKYKQL